MDINEIMVNEEVIETTEEIVNARSGKAFKVAAGVGLAVLTGVVVYKYVAKPILAKIKAQKEQAEINKVAVDTAEYDEVESVAS